MRFEFLTAAMQQRGRCLDRKSNLRGETELSGFISPTDNQLPPALPCRASQPGDGGGGGAAESSPIVNDMLSITPC